MTNIRQLRDRVRRDLHNLAKVPAFYISPYTKLPPRFVEVRLHDKKREGSGQLATSREYSKNIDVQPSIVVLRSQLPFIRSGSTFSFGLGEAYKVESVEPPDGITTKVFVSKLSPQVAERYPFPLPDDDPTVPVEPENPGQGNSQTKYFPLLTPTLRYEVVHNFGNIPNVVILDQDERVITGEIQHNNVTKNSFVVTFNPPVIGEIIVNT